MFFVSLISFAGNRSESRASGVMPRLGFRISQARSTVDRWFLKTDSSGESCVYFHALFDKWSQASPKIPQKHSQDFFIIGLHVHQDALECEERSSLQVDSKHFDQKSTLASSISNGHNFFNFQRLEAILLQSITNSVVYEITSKIKVQVMPQTFSQERLIFLLG